MRAAATISEAPYLSCARPTQFSVALGHFLFLQWVRQQLARDERSEAKARARRRRAARESSSPKDHRRAHRIDPAHYRPPAGQPARPTDPQTDGPTDRPIENSHAPQARTKARTCVQAAVVLSRCSNDYLQVTRERRRGGGTLFWWRLPFVHAVGTSMRVYAMYMPHRHLVWVPAAPLRALTNVQHAKSVSPSRFSTRAAQRETLRASSADLRHRTGRTSASPALSRRFQYA